jgi:peptidoglycan/xylan/chitin deacetylase (PgdA/CDA1 family)
MSRLRGWLRSFIGNRTAPMILMYHRIAAVDCDPWSLAVEPQTFEAQIAHIARARHVLPLNEFIERHRNGRLLSDAVALTFDDGCVCNATTAAPILHRYGLSATFFLATGMIGSREEFWWDRLERIVFDPEAGGGATIRLGSENLVVDLGQEPEDSRGQRAWRALEAPPATMRQQAYMAIWSRLKLRPADEQRSVLVDLASKVGSRIGARASHLPMSVEQARGLSATPGFDIGGHTIDHVSLPCLDAGEQLRQMSLSRRACEDLAGRPCTNFAYPYGDITPRSRELAGEAGFAAAVTTRHATVMETDDPLELPRITVTADSVFGRLPCP